MSLQSQSCDYRRITSLIERRMSAVEEAAMAEHLSGCSACRKALEDASADQQLWQKAERFLRDDDEQSLPLSGTEPHRGPNGGRLVDQVLESLTPTDDPEMLGRVGEYEVSGVIGFGGMGVVLKGFDRSLKRVVAIKVMAPHLASSGPARKRFAREAQAAAAMTHDNIIDIYGVSESNGLPFLVMPYARGTSLQKRIDNDGAQSVVEVLRIGIQVASGLAAAHAQGLVHRDIKPANILLDNGIDRLVITDFGLARAVDDASVTRTGVIAGTPQYMSPEQARGELIEHRSDLFSLGSLMYALCTGRPPFRAETTFGILRRITDNEPRSIREINPEVPEWLCAIIGKLMAKEAGGRFDSAEQVAELLEDCLAHVQQPTAVTLPKSLTTRGSFPFFVRQPIRTGVFLMVSIFSSILLAMLMMQAGEEDAPKAGDNASKDNLTAVEANTTKGEHSRLNARTVVESYVASALTGDVAKAASLAKSTPADPKRIAEWQDLVNIRRLKIKTVYVNDPTNQTTALATSEAVTLEKEHQQPDGQRDGFLVFTLQRTDEGWFVSDIDFESEEGADEELKRFLKSNPNSIGLPPNVPTPKSSKVIVDESNAQPVNRENARSVVESYIASALRGDVAKAMSLAKNISADPKRIAEWQDVLNVRRLRIKTVYVNDPTNPTEALATSEAATLEKEHQQPDGQRDGFLVFTLQRTDEGWFVSDIDFESEEGADDELKRFIKSNPNSIGLPPNVDANVTKQIEHDVRNVEADNATLTHPRKQTIGDDVRNGPVLSSIEGARASSEVTPLTDDSIVFKGEVVTTSGMPLHNAQVFVERPGSTVSVGTDSEGQFQFDSLPSGSFGLKIRFRGRTIAEATGILQSGKNSVRVGVSSPSLATGMFLKTASRKAYVDASLFTEPRNKIWPGEIGPWIGQSDFELVSIYTSEQDQRAAVVAQPIGVLEPDGRVQVLFHLKKIGNNWLISNAQRTTKEDVRSQLIQFVSEFPKAKLSHGMDLAKTKASQHDDATGAELDAPIDFESESGAEEELKRFVEENPNAIGLPPPVTGQGEENVSDPSTPMNENTANEVSVQILVSDDDSEGHKFKAGDRVNVYLLSKGQTRPDVKEKSILENVVVQSVGAIDAKENDQVKWSGQSVVVAASADSALLEPENELLQDLYRQGKLRFYVRRYHDENVSGTTDEVDKPNANRIISDHDNNSSSLLDSVDEVESHVGSLLDQRRKMNNAKIVYSLRRIERLSI